MRNIQGNWVTNPDYRSLLYFTQVLDEMVWEEARELYRIPALNTYHRCVELIGGADEIINAGLALEILEPMFEEILYLANRDPVIKKFYSSALEEFETLCRPADGYPHRIASVKLFYSRISGYLRSCRTLIERLTHKNVISHETDLYVCVGIFASYLLNEGVSASYISDCLHRHFLRRELNEKRVRELQDFFALFPTKSSQFNVYVGVTPSLKELVIGSGAAKAASRNRANPPPPPHELIVFEKIESRDYVSARAHCESLLETARAVAYTVDPHSDVAWFSDITVQDQRGPAA